MKPFLIGLAALAAAGVGAAENAESIIKRFDSQKLAALQQYVQAHPDAPDAADATDAVIAGLLELDRENEAVPLLAKKYDRLSAQKEVSLPMLFGEVIAPLAQLYAKTGQRAAGEAFLERVKKDFAAHEQAEHLAAALAQLKSQFSVPQLGDRLEIKFTATDKREVDLAALKGKVVLVDFWASWCGPCRAEMPNVISAYEKFHDQGFEIVGISLDQQREALDQFLKTRKMPWPQYFDGKGWENEIARKHGITSIPATFLIGKDGAIAAKDLRGTKLTEKIAELIAAK